MYEDLKIVTKTSENNKREREESETISQNRSERATTKKKPAKATRAETDQPGDKPLSEAQLATLGKMRTWYAESLTSLEEHKEDVATYDRHVPSSVKKQLVAAKETVDIALAELNVQIEQAVGEKEELAQLSQKHKETKKEVAAVETKLKVLLKDVKPKKVTVEATAAEEKPEPRNRLTSKTTPKSGGKRGA